MLYQQPHTEHIGILSLSKQATKQSEMRLRPKGSTGWCTKKNGRQGLSTL